MYLIGGYVIGYMVSLMQPALLSWLTLEPAYILRGQVWRLLSWVLVPPSGSLLTIVIMMLLYYQLGTALERTWGAFRYNVYIFSVVVFVNIHFYRVLYLCYIYTFVYNTVSSA